MKSNMAAVPSGPMTSRLFSLNRPGMLPGCKIQILFLIFSFILCFELFKKENFSSEVVL